MAHVPSTVSIDAPYALHDLAVSGCERIVSKQVGKHMPWVPAAAVAEHLVLELVTGLARERVSGKYFVPYAAREHAVKQVTVVRRTVPSEVSELALPRCVWDARHQTDLVVEHREFAAGAKASPVRALRVVRLVDCRKEDLGVRLKPLECACGREVRIKERRRQRLVRAVVAAEEPSDGRRRDKVLHEDRWELDKIGRAPCAGHVVVCSASDHCWSASTHSE